MATPSTSSKQTYLQMPGTENKPMTIKLGLRETSIKHEIVYSHPRERVWQALTESDVLAAWLMENDLGEVTKGETFELQDDPVPLLWDGTVCCEVLAVDPPETLQISWHGGGKNPKTVVTWQLDEVEDGTRLRFTQDGFDGLRGFMMKRGMEGGWKDMYEVALPEVLRRLEVDEPMPAPGELC